METALIPRRQLLLFWQGAVLSLIVASTLGTAYGQSPANDLRFTISLQKTEFKPGRPVVLQMSLENVSDHAIVVNSRFMVNQATGPHEVVLQVVGPDKTTLPFTSKIRASFESGTFVQLQPKQTATDEYDLGQDFELTRPGAYFVRAHYQNEDDAPAQANLPSAWKGTLESNRVEFKLR